MKTVLKTNYEINELKSVQRVMEACDALIAYFGAKRAVSDLSAKHIEDYVAARMRRYARGTVRVEMAYLHRGFTLLLRQGLIDRIPAFPVLRPSPAREGFLEENQFEAILRFLQPYYRPLFRFLYLTGWRVAEARGLKWVQVDRTQRIIRLEAAQVKTGEGRVLPYGSMRELRELLETQWQWAQAIYMLHDRIPEYVFCQPNSKAIGRPYVKAWHRAATKAGYPQRLVHDLRRTAVRRMERAGVQRSVAMKITGHKTESVYRRYAITCLKDIDEGMARIDTFRQNEARSESTGSSGACT